MKRILRSIAAAAAVVLAAGCAHRTDLTKPESQDDFGVRMAKLNLWREAMFRFNRAVQLNPNDAMAHNNLAVAYEANGDFENARKEYLEALKLDRTNAYIQKNYSRYVEFLSRNKKRSAPKSAASAAAGTEAAAKPAATPATQPQPGEVTPPQTQPAPAASAQQQTTPATAQPQPTPVAPPPTAQPAPVPVAPPAMAPPQPPQPAPPPPTPPQPTPVQPQPQPTPPPPTSPGGLA